MTFQSIGEVAARVVAKLPQIEKHPIVGREQWLGLRQLDVTASVAGALLGVHPYASAYSLWALKSGLLTEDPEETAPMRRGRLLEPVAVQLLREERPDWQITYPVQTYYRDPKWRLGATPDVLAIDERGRPGIVQIKSVEPGIFRSQWRGEDREVVPPLWIACQAIVERYLTGFEWAAVCPLVVSHGLEMPIVDIPIHEGVIDRIKSETQAFWQAVALKKAPDPDLHRDAKLIERLFEPSGEEVDLSKDNELPALATRRARRLAYIRKAEDQVAELKTSIIRKLGNASAARIADGRTITAKRVHTKAHVRAASSRIDIRVKAPKESSK